MRSAERNRRQQTINDDFAKLLTNIEPTLAEKTAIQKHRETIDQALVSSPDLVLYSKHQPSFLTGSYKRSTMIRPVKDVDLYVKVHYEKHAEAIPPKRVMTIILRILRKRYPFTVMAKDSPCILVRFKTLTFEVVPVYGHEGDEEKFSVPNSDGSQWIECYPDLPHRWLSSCNHNNNRKFVPVIKILKQWRECRNVHLKSFHLELLTGLVFDRQIELFNYPQAIYDWMFYVCRWMHEHSYPFIEEPGKTGIFVDDYMYKVQRKLNVLRIRLLQGLEMSQKAYYAYLNGQIGKAQLLYHRMFGSAYPKPIDTKMVATPPENAPTRMPGEKAINPSPSYYQDPFQFKLADLNSGRNALNQSLNQNKSIAQIMAKALLDSNQEKKIPTGINLRDISKKDD